MDVVESVGEETADVGEELERDVDGEGRDDETEVPVRVGAVSPPVVSGDELSFVAAGTGVFGGKLVVSGVTSSLCLLLPCFSSIAFTVSPWLQES